MIVTKMCFLSSTTISSTIAPSLDRCSDKIPGSKYQWVKIPADKIPLSKYCGQNTAVQNTAGHNTGVKIPVVIIPYWTKYHTGHNTILDKIPCSTKYRTGQNTALDIIPHRLYLMHYNSLKTFNPLSSQRLIFRHPESPPPPPTEKTHLNYPLPL